MKSNSIFADRFLRVAAALAVFVALNAGTVRAAESNALYFTSERIDFRALLPSPPAVGSPEQTADLLQVRSVLGLTSSNEMTLARAESKLTIFAFTPAIGATFQPGTFPKMEALFAHVEDTTKAATDAAEDFWQRPRPYTIETNLARFGEVEKSFSYPSGHSTRGTVYALVLAELFPDRKDAILTEGRTIGWHRVQIARHYPTDIFAGRVLAQAIVRELKSNPAFQRDFAAAKLEIAVIGLNLSASPVPAK